MANLPSSSPQEQLEQLSSPAKKPTPQFRLKPQEIPFDHSESTHFFHPSSSFPFVATPAAIKCFGLPTILRCLQHLQIHAIQHDGLDSLQVFEIEGTADVLWVMEDSPDGGITALLPSDY